MTKAELLKKMKYKNGKIHPMFKDIYDTLKYHHHDANTIRVVAKQVDMMWKDFWKKQDALKDKREELKRLRR